VRQIEWTHELLVYFHYANQLEDNTDTVKKNRETLIEASKRDGIEVSAEKIKYMLLPRHQNAGQNMLGNRSFENVA
jgi:hypothetical protein